MPQKPAAITPFDPDAAYREIMGGGGSSKAFDPDAAYNEIISGSKEKRSLGATGSWEEPDAAQKLQINHPYLSMPLTAPAKIGRGALDALYGGTVGLAKTVASPPSTPEEIRLEASSPGIGGAALIAAKRLLIDPGRTEYQKAKESPTALGRIAHKAAAFTPVVGPIASHLYERGVTEGDPLGAFGEAATMYLMGKVGSEVTGAIAKNRASPNVHAEINALSTLAKPAKNQAPQSIAANSQHFIKRAIEEAGEDPATFQLSKTDISNPKADQYGDLYRGGTAEQAEKFAKAYDIELDPNNPTPISSMVMERAVEIADRPIQKVTQAFAQQRVPVVKAKIIAGLQKLAQGTVDKSLKDAYNSMIQMAMDSGDTVADINALKVHANKEINRVYKMLPQQAINASASPSFAWKDVGDLVREHLYPELERLQGPEGGASLRAAGRLESNVINMRDGVMESWTNAAKQHAENMQESKLGYIFKGQSEQAHFAPSLRSSATVGAASRALIGRTMPLKEFNKRFTQGIGVGSSLLPSQYKAAWKPPSISPTLAGQQTDIVPFGEDVHDKPLLSSPEGFSRRIGEEVFKVQQRADREARSAPPPTLTGEHQDLVPFTQGPSEPPLGGQKYGSKGTYPSPEDAYATDLRQRSLWQSGERQLPKGQLSFGERATPQWTGEPGRSGEFFPGKQGPMREPLLDEHGLPTSEGGRILKEIRDYRRQSQLFGIDQSKPSVPKFSQSIGTPPVRNGYVRMYRAESVPGSGRGLPEWLQGVKTPSDEAGRRWFTTSKENAQWYLSEAEAEGGKGHIRYVDVPASVAKDALNAPEVSRFSRNPSVEAFIPSEWESKAIPYADDTLISTQDLKTTLNEIQVYLKNNPTSGQRSQLMMDSIDLLREINRRYAASQVNKK